MKIGIFALLTLLVSVEKCRAASSCTPVIERIFKSLRSIENLIKTTSKSSMYLATPILVARQSAKHKTLKFLGSPRYALLSADPKELATIRDDSARQHQKLGLPLLSDPMLYPATGAGRGELSADQLNQNDPATETATNDSENSRLTTKKAGRNQRGGVHRELTDANENSNSNVNVAAVEGTGERPGDFDKPSVDENVNANVNTNVNTNNRIFFLDDTDLND